MKKEKSAAMLQDGALPASVVTQRHGVSTTTAVATTTTTVTTATSPATASVAAAATAAVPSHLGKAGVDLLLSFLKDVDQFTSLFGVCKGVSGAILTSWDE